MKQSGVCFEGSISTNRFDVYYGGSLPDPGTFRASEWSVLTISLLSKTYVLITVHSLKLIPSLVDAGCSDRSDSRG